MARIYYKERKIAGNTINNKFITSGKVSFLFENSNKNWFELKSENRRNILSFFTANKETFNYVQLSKDDIFYNDSKYGSFYLPNAIIFYDNDDFNFPTKFYFLTQIDESLELRECNGGKDIKWHQIPNLHNEVTDKKIINKIKNTIEKVLNLVKTKYFKQEEKPKVKKEKTLIQKSEKEAYQELCKYCITNEQKRKEICDFFETLKNYQDDEEYYTTLNFVMEFLETNDYNFIMRMDWKSDVENLEWLINSVLEENYKELNIELPQYDKNDDYLTVSSDNVFESFSNSLKKHHLQLGFVDTQSDEYISIIHKIEDRDKIKGLINKIGYEYFEK